MLSYYIAAAHKSSGKTSISIGLTRALSNRGLKVQSFKKGPDYIDPIWLRSASQQACYNLDFNTQNDEELLTLFNTKGSLSDISIIEGNKGLYDGLDLEGSDSNAAMAKLLDVPVILTIDTIGITRGIAPLLQGYQSFDPEVNFTGVILNKVGTSRHESKLRAAIERYTDFKVIGSVGFDSSLSIPERHLGLQPANESEVAEKVINNLAKAILEGVDLKNLIDSEPPSVETNVNVIKDVIEINSISQPLKIAIAQDTAFGFYYDDDLEAFECLGVELITIDTLNDEHLPSVDGLFIGGGFPETQMETLSQNTSLMNDIKTAIEGGLPTYAECGGLMYLSQSIRWQDEQHPMVGVIPGDILMHKKPQGRGYAKLTETAEMLWPDLQSSQEVAAHEFHYASLENLPEDSQFAYKVNRGFGINGTSDGLVIHNLLANFSHLRNTQSFRWVERFVQFVRSTKTSKAQHND